MSPRRSIDSYLWRICREAVELDKINFSKRGKIHRDECNQASYSTKDPNNMLSFQKHLSTKKMHIIHDPKHTHTLNKSNQIYISKTSQDILVSIY